MSVRSHGRVLCSIWSDPQFQALTPEAQRLYLLLLSQRSVNNAGVLPLMPGKWAKGCATTTTSDVLAALAELAENRFAVVDDETEEVLIRSFIRGDGIVSVPNVFKNALRCALDAESPGIRAVLADELSKLGRRDADEAASKLTNGQLETRPEPVVNPSEKVPDPINDPSRTLSEPIASPSGTHTETLRSGLGLGKKGSVSTHSPQVVKKRDAHSAPPSRKPKATTIPDDWSPSTDANTRLAERFPVIAQMPPDRRREFFADQLFKFRNSAIAHGRRYASWDAAWRTWVQNAVTVFAPKGGLTGGEPNPLDGYGAGVRSQIGWELLSPAPDPEAVVLAEAAGYRAQAVEREALERGGS